MTSKPQSDLVLRAHRNGVTTLTMNMPSRLNGWTLEMMVALKDAFRRAAEDEATKAVILTGAERIDTNGLPRVEAAGLDAWSAAQRQ